MTADDAGAALDAIRTRAAAATEGPWEADCVAETAEGRQFGVWIGEQFVTVEPADDDQPGDYVPVTPADAYFIAHAREDVPRLLAAVDAVLGLCADPDPDTDDGMTLVSVDAIRAAITEALTRKEEA